MMNAQELEEQFGVIEGRVQALKRENRALRERIVELEGDLAEARKDARNGVQMSGVTDQVRERIERVLQSLEAIGAVKQEESE